MTGSGAEESPEQVVERVIWEHANGDPAVLARAIVAELRAAGYIRERIPIRHNPGERP